MCDVAQRDCPACRTNAHTQDLAVCVDLAYDERILIRFLRLKFLLSFLALHESQVQIIIRAHLKPHRGGCVTHKHSSGTDGGSMRPQCQLPEERS